MLRLLSKVTDNDTVATDDVLGNTILVNLAKTNPLTKLLGVRNLEELDLVLGTESLNKTKVFLLLARLSQDTKMGLTAVQGLDTLTDTTGETVVDQGATEDFDEGGLSGDLANDGRDSFNNISFS